ncbi:MAG: helix-turn-helix domain-containing protein [Terriglobia bacterium]
MQKELLARLEQIQADLKEIKKAASKPYNLAEAANYLDVSKSHLYQLTCKGLIAHYKPAGKRIYFDKTDLDRYLKRNRIASAEEIEETAMTHIVTRTSRT